MTTEERSAVYGTDDNLQPRPRRKRYMVVIEEPNGNFMYRTMYGWTNVGPGSEAHKAITTSNRYPLPKRVSKREREGLAAFGKPFAVDMYERAS